MTQHDNDDKLEQAIHDQFQPTKLALYSVLITRWVAGLIIAVVLIRIMLGY